MGKNKVKFNLKNVHYAPISTAEDGTLTFGTPKHIPGAVSFTADSESEEVKFMADGVLYYTSYSNTGYKGTLIMALITDEFRKDILGDVEDPSSHVLAEYSTTESVPFALLYEIDGDQKATRRVMYNCTVSRPGESADGQNPKTPQTEAMNITAAPLADGLIRARTMDNTTDDVFNDWFKSVWKPSSTPASVQEPTNQTETEQGGT